MGGTPELVDDGESGILVPVADDSALASAIERVLTHTSQRTGMGEMASRKVLERFDWTNTVGRYLAVYDQLLAGAAVGFEHDWVDGR